MKTPPLFKDIYQFNVLMLNTTKSFPKDFKFSLGNRIKEHSLDVLEIINLSIFENKKEKLEFIEAIHKKMQSIRLLIRLCMDTKCINVLQIGLDMKARDFFLCSSEHHWTH